MPKKLEDLRAGQLAALYILIEAGAVQLPADQTSETVLIALASLIGDFGAGEAIGILTECMESL